MREDYVVGYSGLSEGDEASACFADTFLFSAAQS
jgi:hypothetical protein